MIKKVLRFVKVIFEITSLTFVIILGQVAIILTITSFKNTEKNSMKIEEYRKAILEKKAEIEDLSKSLNVESINPFEIKDIPTDYTEFYYYAFSGLVLIFIFLFVYDYYKKL